jgi:hypothetical protein
VSGDGGFDDSALKRLEALVANMTPEQRAFYNELLRPGWGKIVQQRHEARAQAVWADWIARVPPLNRPDEGSDAG